MTQDCPTKIPVQMIRVMKAMDLTKFHLSKGISVTAYQKSWFIIINDINALFYDVIIMMRPLRDG